MQKSAAPAPANVPLEERLARFLEPRIPNADRVIVTNLKQMTEGFSYRTFTFTAGWGGKTLDLVVRMEPEDTIAVGPCGIESQFRLLLALQQTNIPVPRVLWLNMDRTVLDRPFFVMQRVEGEVPIPWGSANQDTALRQRMAQKFVEVLARIHLVDWERLGLDFLLGDAKPRPQPPAQREIARWANVVTTLALRPEPILTEALLWLKRHQPKATKMALVHGDYRMGNFIWKDARIQAILDWEIASIGDPMCDLGWLALRCWRGETPDLLSGLIERERLYSLYEEYGGAHVDPERVRFWEVLGNVHMAAILIQIMRGFQDRRVQDLRLIPMEDYLYRPILKELTELLEL